MSEALNFVILRSLTKGGQLMANQRRSSNTVTVNRNAKNGQFVSQSYVRRHPNTTETEKRPRK